MNMHRTVFTFNIIIALGFLARLILQPILVDTAHMDDTQFLANLGWRGVNGLTPVLDFAHFYGGVTAQFVTWAFQVFGVSYLSINYAFAMMFAASVCVLWALGWQRLSTSGLALLTALSAALLLSLYPIEMGRLIRPVIAHSYVYNHAAIILMMALTVFALSRAKSGKVEITSAILAGITLYVLALLKPTFAVFAPCVILACLLQARWLSAGLVLLGAGAGMLILDPGMGRVLGSLDYLLNSAVAESVNLIFFINNSIKIVSQQAVALVVVMILLLKQKDITIILSALVLLGGYGAALLTMGGAPDLKILPMLVVIALTSVAWSNRNPQALVNPEGVLIKALPFALAYVLILPAFLSAMLASAILMLHKDSSLITAGLAKNYVVVSGLSFRSSAKDVNFAEKVKKLILNTPEKRTERDEYAMFADGIALLQEVPELASYGIISNGRMFDFTMPLGSPPVASFPVWPTANLAYFAGPDPLPEDVDAVMISIDVPNLGLINRELIDKMGTDFKFCRKSTIWTLYLRNGLPEKFCSPAE